MFFHFIALNRVSQITLLMCSLIPGFVALICSAVARRSAVEKHMGADYVIHSVQPFCHAKPRLVLIHLAPRGGSEAGRSADVS